MFQVYLNHNNLHYLSENLLPWNQMEKLSLNDNPWACSWENEWMKNLKDKDYVIGNITNM